MHQLYCRTCKVNKTKEEYRNCIDLDHTLDLTIYSCDLCDLSNAKQTTYYPCFKNNYTMHFWKMAEYDFETCYYCIQAYDKMEGLDIKEPAI